MSAFFLGVIALAVLGNGLAPILIAPETSNGNAQFVEYPGQVHPFVVYTKYVYKPHDNNGSYTPLITTARDLIAVPRPCKGCPSAFMLVCGPNFANSRLTAYDFLSNHPDIPLYNVSIPETLLYPCPQMMVSEDGSKFFTVYAKNGDIVPTVSVRDGKTGQEIRRIPVLTCLKCFAQLLTPMTSSSLLIVSEHNDGGFYYISAFDVNSGKLVYRSADGGINVHQADNIALIYFPYRYVDLNNNQTTLLPSEPKILVPFQSTDFLGLMDLQPSKQCITAATETGVRRLDMKTTQWGTSLWTLVKGRFFLFVADPYVISGSSDHAYIYNVETKRELQFDGITGVTLNYVAVYFSTSETLVSFSCFSCKHHYLYRLPRGF